MWYLSKVKDSFGNTVSYTYLNDSANNYTYLSDIQYTGYEKSGDKGAFRVHFVLETSDREDRRLDCRGTFASKLARRLQKVELFYKEALVQSFLFSYKYNEFGQSLLSGYAEADGASSTPFYNYTFDYYALGRHDDGGYDAFEAEAPWTLANVNQFSGLNSTSTTSIGGGSIPGNRNLLLASFYWQGGSGELRDSRRTSVLQRRNARDPHGRERGRTGRSGLEREWSALCLPEYRIGV